MFSFLYDGADTCKQSDADHVSMKLNKMELLAEHCPTNPPVYSTKMED